GQTPDRRCSAASESGFFFDRARDSARSRRVLRTGRGRARETGRFAARPLQADRPRQSDGARIFWRHDAAALHRAMMHDPQVLFLDEPSAGLDPQTKLLLWEIIREYNQTGKTILLTTHNMEEA